jgi:hypothetical protein
LCGIFVKIKFVKNYLFNVQAEVVRHHFAILETTRQITTDHVLAVEFVVLVVVLLEALFVF